MEAESDEAEVVKEQESEKKTVGQDTNTVPLSTALDELYSEMITWLPNNVVAGPAMELRGSDPGAHYDMEAAKISGKDSLTAQRLFILITKYNRQEYVNKDTHMKNGEIEELKELLRKYAEKPELKKTKDDDWFIKDKITRNTGTDQTLPKELSDYYSVPKTLLDRSILVKDINDSLDKVQKTLSASATKKVKGELECKMKDFLKNSSNLLKFKIE